MILRKWFTTQQLNNLKEIRLLATYRSRYRNFSTKYGAEKTEKKEKEKDTSTRNVVIDSQVEKMPVSQKVRENLYGMGIRQLTAVQTRCFNPIVQGRSLVARSETGSGKTVAYLLPILERIQTEKMTTGTSVLILVPTRELAKQVGGVVLSLSPSQNVALLYGGSPMEPQAEVLKLGVNLVVGTPDRVLQLVEKKTDGIKWHEGINTYRW
eukprot:Platyproteum_vivax@DN10401_c0_g1_i1.p1